MRTSSQGIARSALHAGSSNQRRALSVRHCSASRRRPASSMRAFVLLLVLAACAHRAVPEDTVRAYLAALDKDDPDAAYKLLSQETRREVTPEQFVAHWRENRDAARSESAAVREGLGHGVAEDA